MARVFGSDVVTSPSAVRSKLGVVFGGDRGFYPRLTGAENLRFAASLSGLNGNHARARVQSVLGAVSLLDVADRPVKDYSRGMRQRLHLARGLLGTPAGLLLDEPTIGLDPEHAEEFRQHIPRFARPGRVDIANDALHGRGGLSLRPYHRLRVGKDDVRGNAGAS